MCNQGGSGPPQPAVQRRLCSQPQRCLLSHSCWLLDTFWQTEEKRKKKNNAEFSPVLLVTLSSPLPEFICRSWQPWVEVHPSRGFFSFYEDVTLQTDGTFHFKPAVSFSFSGWIATHLIALYWIIDIFLEGFRPKLSSVNPWRNWAWIFVVCLVVESNKSCFFFYWLYQGWIFSGCCSVCVALGASP